jgi:Fic family protein
VRLSVRWVEVLQQSKSVGTYQLAHRILIEAFRRELMGKEIVLSTKVTGMTRATRMRAANELVKLGLIKIRKERNRATRVISII